MEKMLVRVMEMRGLEDMEKYSGLFVEFGMKGSASKWKTQKSKAGLWNEEFVVGVLADDLVLEVKLLSQLDCPGEEALVIGEGTVTLRTNSSVMLQTREEWFPIQLAKKRPFFGSPKIKNSAYAHNWNLYHNQKSMAASTVKVNVAEIKFSVMYGRPASAPLHYRVPSAKPVEDSVIHRDAEDQEQLNGRRFVRPVALRGSRVIAQPQPKYPISLFTAKFMPEMNSDFDPRSDLLVDCPPERYVSSYCL